MEFKLRANLVMSKELTVEAGDMMEAMDKAQEIMSGPIRYKDLTVTQLYYDMLSPMKWMDDSKLLNYDKEH